MNQKQREFLIEQVNKSYKRETEYLEKENLEEPSFSNYIVAAVLDGSVKIKSNEHIKAMVKEAVLKLNRNNSSLFETDSYFGSRSRHRDEEIFKINAKELFEIPKAYQIAFDEYSRKKKEHQKKISDLTKVRDTLILKIQIGSDKALQTLIDQADQLADLKIMNAQLTSTTKLLAQ